MEKIKFKKNSTAPPARANSILVPHNKSFVLYGGGSRLAEFSDIWAVSIQKSSEPIWKQLPLKEEKSKLPARIGMAYTKVDNQIFIHGGQNFNENKHFDEFFKLNLETLEMKQIKPADKKIWPDARNSHSLVHDKLNDRLVLFGGADSEGPLESIFVYSLSKEKWEEVPNKMKELKAREMHTAHIFYCDEGESISSFIKKDVKNVKSTVSTDQKKLIEVSFDNSGIKESEPIEQNNSMKPVEIVKKDIVFEGVALEEQKLNEEEITVNEKSLKTQSFMIIIGGRTMDKISNEILSVDLNKWVCTSLFKLPHGICSHSSVLIGNELYIYAGTDGTGFLNTLYCFDLRNGNLKRFIVEDELKSIGGRIAANMVEDEDGNLVIFGGSTFEEEKNDVIVIRRKEIVYES